MTISWQLLSRNYGLKLWKVIIIVNKYCYCKGMCYWKVIIIVNKYGYSMEVYICVCKQPINDSGNGLSPIRCQAIILTNAGIVLTGSLATNFNDILIDIHIFSFKTFENIAWTMATILSRSHCFEFPSFLLLFVPKIFKQVDSLPVHRNQCILMKEKSEIIYPGACLSSKEF